MTPKYLLDTNVLSEALRPRPNASVLEHLAREGAALATATPVWHEIWFGASRLPMSRRRHAIERFLTNVVQATMPILPYDTVAARWHAEQRARLARAGKTAPFVDGQIAAIAAVNGLTLVTNDQAGFASFEGIKVVNWHHRG